MKLSELVVSLEVAAENEWKRIEDEAIDIFQKVEPVVESALAELFRDFGALAVSTVINLMTDAGKSLSGGEKLNLTVTTVVDAAEKVGKSILAAHVTTLAQSAYAAVMGKAPVPGETVAEAVADVGAKVAEDVAAPIEPASRTTEVP